MSSQQSAIHTPKSLWAKIIEKSRAESRKPDGRPDAFVFFLGAQRGGKSTLLNRFLYPDRVDIPKPSEGLEYTYARRSRENDHEKKDIAHIWEFGGGEDLACELGGVESVFLGAKQVTTAVVVIVVDLSEPSQVLPELLKWMNLVKQRLGTTFEKLEKRGSKLPEQLRIRARKALYGGNEDRDVVEHSGISVVVAATKYDKFMNQDAELCKVMARTLRYVAHTNGAHLLYLGGLDGKRPAEEQSNLKTKVLLDNFRRVLNHLIFSGLEKKMYA
ncbi:hypothetical protein BSKO_00852 [Bryopsis sp. KO-2023]|nr:hypothetical protein BSKO_00852 [Bryopsis sp. KO-2023]